MQRQYLHGGDIWYNFWYFLFINFLQTEYLQTYHCPFISSIQSANMRYQWMKKNMIGGRRYGGEVIREIAILIYFILLICTLLLWATGYTRCDAARQFIAGWWDDKSPQQQKKAKQTMCKGGERKGGRG